MDSLAQQAKELQNKLVASLVEGGMDRMKARGRVLFGEETSPELDAIMTKIKMARLAEQDEEEAKLKASLQRYEAGNASNADYFLLASAGYGYTESSEFGMSFVFTGKRNGDPYQDWREENMLGVEEETN